MTEQAKTGVLRVELSTLREWIKADGERHEREMVRAEARYAELMASYRMLRLQGFTPAPEAAAPAAPPKIDPVTAAINRCAKDARTREIMQRQVEADRLVNPEITDVELVARIERGHRPAEEFA